MDRTSKAEISESSGSDESSDESSSYESSSKGTPSSDNSQSNQAVKSPPPRIAGLEALPGREDETPRSKPSPGRSGAISASPGLADLMSTSPVCSLAASPAASPLPMKSTMDVEDEHSEDGSEDGGNTFTMKQFGCYKVKFDGGHFYRGFALTHLPDDGSDDGSVTAAPGHADGTNHDSLYSLGAVVLFADGEVIFCVCARACMCVCAHICKCCVHIHVYLLCTYAP